MAPLCREGCVARLKQVRSRLVGGCRDALGQLVEDATGARVVAMHTDLSARTGERGVAFGRDEDLDAPFDAWRGARKAGNCPLRSA